MTQLDLDATLREAESSGHHVIVLAVSSSEAAAVATDGTHRVVDFLDDGNVPTLCKAVRDRLRRCCGEILDKIEHEQT